MADVVERDPEPRAEERPAPERATSPAVWAIVVVAALALAAFIALIAANSGDDPEVVTVEVPAGASADLGSGEQVELIDSVLHLEPGQALELDNGDDRVHVIGDLRADAGEAVRQVFDTEGRNVVETSLRTDGLVTILVEEPED